MIFDLWLQELEKNSFLHLTFTEYLCIVKNLRFFSVFINSHFEYEFKKKLMIEFHF